MNNPIDRLALTQGTAELYASIVEYTDSHLVSFKSSPSELVMTRDEVIDLRNWLNSALDANPLPKELTFRETWDALEFGARVPGHVLDRGDWVKVDSNHYLIVGRRSDSYDIGMWMRFYALPASEVSSINLNPKEYSA